MQGLFRNSVRPLPSMPTIKELLRLYNLKALKQLSQNFLLDIQVAGKIVKAAGFIEGGLVCEVGPGPGGITRAILTKCPKYLLLVEKDIRFKPILESLKDAAREYCKVDAKYADIVGFNMEPLFCETFKKEWDDTPPNIHIIGNLPFDVSTYLITRWLMDISLRSNAWKYGRVQLTLTFQKEVAERIVAPILSPSRCRLSVMCQNWCWVAHKFTFPGRIFLPPPEVDVGVVTLIPRVNPIIELPFPLVEKVVRTVFGCRQKYIEKGASNLFPVAFREDLTKELLKTADLDGTARPFQLSVEEFGRICRSYKDICDRNPGMYDYNFRGPKNSREFSWKDKTNNSNSEDSFVTK